MAISAMTQKNFETLKQAAENGDMGIIECTDRKTGEKVPVLMAVNESDDGSYEVVPFAIMLEEDPYERLIPPDGVEDIK